jgi:hypothetical protein
MIELNAALLPVTFSPGQLLIMPFVLLLEHLKAIPLNLNETTGLNKWPAESEEG